MNRFWRYARMMLRYRALLTAALVGAVLDALCQVGGFGALIVVIGQFFEKNRPMRELVLEELRQAPAWLGDPTGLAEWIPSGPIAGLAAVLGVILALTILGSIGRFLHEYSTITVSMRTIMQVRRRVFSHLILTPMPHAGDMNQRINHIQLDTQTLGAGFSAVTSRAVRGVFSGTGMFLYALWKDWSLTALFLLAVPPIFILIHHFGRRIRKATSRALAQYGVMLAAVIEVFGALRVVKVHHTEGYERRRFARITRVVLRRELKARAVKAMSSPITETLMILGVMGVMMFGAWLVFERGREPRELAAVMMLLALSGMQFRTLTGLNNTLYQAEAAAERLDAVLQGPVEPTARQEFKQGRIALARHRHSVEFRQVRYTYPGTQTPAIDGVSLLVPHGAMCAVVGGNGSGKSTLLNLLPRLHEPQQGQVLIDGVDIAGCTLRSLRRQIAMVTQETVLFEGTIAQNICYGSRHATMERIAQAAERAHADEFIRALPEGYDAPIGERGSRLSGGQRQRLAIARAILRDPAILILDEATSQIDADSEAKIADALAAFIRDRTTFVIAHRLSTIVGADLIVVMDQGRIAAVGNHARLMAESPIYQMLCRTQMIDAAG